MFAVNALSLGSQMLWGYGDTLDEAWSDLLVENDIEENQIDFKTVEWFSKVDGVERETVTRWVSPDFE
jgi:hypothetical protein